MCSTTFFFHSMFVNFIALAKVPFYNFNKTLYLLVHSELLLLLLVHSDEVKEYWHKRTNWTKNLEKISYRFMPPLLLSRRHVSCFAMLHTGGHIFMEISITSLKHFLHKMNTDPYLVTLICDYLPSWHSNIPPTASHKLRFLLDHQDLLGPQAFFESWLHPS